MLPMSLSLHYTTITCSCVQRMAACYAAFPLLTPQEELAQWQAHQAAEPAAASKKAAKKAPAGKGGKADPNAADQRNAWYPEVNKAEQM